MTPVGLLLSSLLVLGLALTSTLALNEVPLVNVSLTGGPEPRVITPGVNFELTCNYSASLPGSETWKPSVTFYKDAAQLGRFEKLEKSGVTAVYWNTVNLIPGMNVFSSSPVAPEFTSTYTIQVQPLAFDAQGRYGCSVLVENDQFTKARYFSNPIDIRPVLFAGGPQAARRQQPQAPAQPQQQPPKAQPPKDGL